MSVMADLPSTVSVPNLGDASVVVCAQNCRYYYAENLAYESCDYHNVAGLEAKTAKMVNAFREIDADVYALCELEPNDSAIHYLTNAMNADAGYEKYMYVKDNVTATSSYTVVKSGYIFRKDRMTVYGDNKAASSGETYGARMRTQIFKELATGEQFVLSVNHFKSKRSSGNDDTESQRVTNATNLISALSKYFADPDKLIVGDLNETTSEEAVQMLVNAGYSEQLERFNPSAYSYVYGSNNQLIDHVLANDVMAEQVTGAGVMHINTASMKNYTWKSQYYYSDHDPVLVGLKLGKKGNDDSSSSDCTPLNSLLDLTYDLGGMQAITTIGTTEWQCDATYGAKINAYNKTGECEAYLISPEYDLSGMESASITLNHNIYYNNAGGEKYKDYQTLLVTHDYTGDPTTTQWTKVDITNYAVKAYVDAVMSVPSAHLEKGFRFALRYYTPSGGNTANYWEVRTAILKAACKSQTSLEENDAEKLTAETAERIYTITGMEVTAARHNLPAGIYVLVSGRKVQKISVR